MLFSFLNQPISQPSQPPPQQTIVEQLGLKQPKFLPEPGIFYAAGSHESISLFFEVPIDTQSVRITSNPSLQFDVEISPEFPKRIILTPRTPWAPDTTYTITISKGLRSSVGLASDGEENESRILELKENLQFQYTLKSLPESEFYPGSL